MTFADIIFPGMIAVVFIVTGMIYEYRQSNKTSVKMNDIDLDEKFQIN